MKARHLLWPCAAAVTALSMGGCGAASVTQARVENSVAPAFAQLYAQQQRLLGKGAVPGAQASADCHRSTRGSGNTGAGDDWVCQLLLQVGGQPSGVYTYDLNVKANGCYTADGPQALVGGKSLTTPTGRSRVNPLFAFDGCFET
ncbi:MAG TPA: hypothetical protein VFA83_04265 [Acidimicrobiales bacterium]|nr:hypothetical protein [Acidimicrobiales bacterium]